MLFCGKGREVSSGSFSGRFARGLSEAGITLLLEMLVRGHGVEVEGLAHLFAHVATVVGC